MSGAINDQNIAQLAQAVNLFAYITVCLVDWYCWEAILPAFSFQLIRSLFLSVLRMITDFSLFASIDAVLASRCFSLPRPYLKPPVKFFPFPHPRIYDVKLIRLYSVFNYKDIYVFIVSLYS
jgi:hypothetical protein